MAVRANSRRFVVHQLAVEVVHAAAELARDLRGPAAGPRGDQVVRAACAITANIAEACGRGTVGEFRQFLGYARGSAHELRSHLHISRILDPQLKERCGRLESRTTLVIKMLARLQEHPPPE